MNTAQTVLLMSALLLSADALAEPRESPLVIQQQGLEPGCLDLAKLSEGTQIALRAPRPDEASYVAEVGVLRAGTVLVVRLASPSGVDLAARSLGLRHTQACEAAQSLLAELLRANLPDVSPGAEAPAVPDDAKRRWRIDLGLGAELMPVLLHLAVGADLKPRSLPLGVGLELVAKEYASTLFEKASPAYAFSGRLLGGYRDGAGAWEWAVLALAGGRVGFGFVGPADQAFGAAELGARAELSKQLGSGVSLGADVSAMWLVPKASLRPALSYGQPLIELGLVVGYGVVER